MAVSRNRKTRSIPSTTHKIDGRATDLWIQQLLSDSRQLDLRQWRQIEGTKRSTLSRQLKTAAELDEWAKEGKNYHDGKPMIDNGSPKRLYMRYVTQLDYD